jgi:hypothetical protein
MPSTPHFDVVCAADGHHRNLASDRRKKVVTEGRGSIGDLLKAARRARASNEAFFLSGQHYMEMSEIRDPRQPQGIATVSWSRQSPGHYFPGRMLYGLNSKPSSTWHVHIMDVRIVGISRSVSDARAWAAQDRATMSAMPDDTDSIHSYIVSGVSAAAVS